MLLIYLLLGSALMFQSGVLWAEYKINRSVTTTLFWSIGLGFFGLYMLISMIGRASAL